MDHLRAMRIFVKIVDEGGFASAARVLDVAPALVTRALAELEAHLGTRLVNRTTRRIALTEIGEQYLERTRTLLDDVSATEDMVSSAQHEPRGTLRLRVPAAFAVHQLAKHLPRFHSLYPQVTVEVCTSGSVEDVNDGHDLTIVLRHHPLDGEFVARPLAQTEVIMCASPEYLDRRGRPSHPGELGEHLLLVQPSTQGRFSDLTFRRVADRTDARRDGGYAFQPRSAAPLSTMNAELCYAGALAGLGVCWLPSFVVEDALHESALERVLPEWRLQKLTLWVCMPSRKHVPARTRAMLDFLVETFGGRDHDPWLMHATCETRPVPLAQAPG